MSSRSYKKIHEAEKLHQDYRNYFGSRYSASRSPSSDDINSIGGILKIIVSSKCRLFILFCICVVVSMYILYSSKPRWVMNKKKSYDEQNKISIYYLFMYSILFGLILSICVSMLAYKFPNLKPLLFKSDDCDLCKD